MACKGGALALGAIATSIVSQSRVVLESGRCYAGATGAGDILCAVQHVLLHGLGPPFSRIIVTFSSLVDSVCYGGPYDPKFSVAPHKII